MAKVLGPSTLQSVTHERSRLLGLVPPRVRDVIRARLARLSPAAATLLAASSVLDHGFTYEQICQVADVGEREGLPALDELLGSRLLLEESRSSLRPYAFAHDKIRDVVYTEAGDARRRIYHRRALEVLPAAGAPAIELAHHALAAGSAPPPSNTVSRPVTTRCVCLPSVMPSFFTSRPGRC